MKQYPKAAEGLKLMFYGELLAIIGILLTIILIGPIIALVGEILVLVGLYRARMDDEGYGTAFMLSIVNIVLSIVGLFVPSDGLLGSLLSIISTIISLAIIYFVCSTTGNLLLSQGESALAQRGQTVWTINLVCAIVSVVLSLLMWIPLLNILAVVGVIVVMIAELVGYILYMMVLSSSYKLL